jgi:hypothetical protein
MKMKMKRIIAALILFSYSNALGATDRTLDGKFITSGSALLTLPTSTDTLMGRNTTDTMTNKTLTSPVINTPTGIVKGDVGLSNVDDVQQLPMSYLDTDVALTADSDLKVPSQKAIKAYVDGQAFGISNVVEDTTPQLGGNLDVNGFDIYLQSGKLSQNLSKANLHFPTDLSVKIEQAEGGNNILIDSDSIDLNAASGEINVLSNIDMQTTKKIINLADGTVSGDAVNKGQLDLKADLASPAFTGVPTAPTQTPNNNSTQIATTAYVDNAVSSVSVAPSIVGSSGSPTAITAAGGISFSGTNYENIKFIAGDAGAINITASPQITAATNVGQKLVLISKDATNTVTLEDGAGLSLNGAWVGGLDSVLELMFDGTNWVEKSRR